MDCGGVLVKYILFIFNILFLVCGILLIVFGSLIVSQFKDFEFTEAGLLANSVPIVIIVLGCIIFLISFLGCCGAIREESCCTMTYSVIMFVLFIAQVLLVAFVWFNRGQFLEAIDKGINTVWNQRQNDQNVMNVVQLSLNCCGLNGPASYGLQQLPASCCGAEATTCTILTAVPTGCLTAAHNVFSQKIDLLRYAGLGVAVVELVAFIFGCCLANQVRNNRRRLNY